MNHPTFAYKFQQQKKNIKTFFFGVRNPKKNQLKYSLCLVLKIYDMTCISRVYIYTQPYLPPYTFRSPFAF